MIRIGIDLYSLRSQGWDAFRSLEYCASVGASVVHFSEIRFLGSLDTNHLRRVREAAQRLGLDVEIGMRSVCPSSNLFDPLQGTAEEQLSRMVDAARVIGSPIVRAFMGNRFDRTGEVPLEAHIENTIRVLRAVRSRAIDAGIRIAVENHGGDLRASELKCMIEQAGTEFVGACIDNGNMPITMDVPITGLEILSPYVLTSHLRDSRICRTPQGAAVEWVPVGQGNIDIHNYLRRYLELCPGRSISIEMIRIEPKRLDFLASGFWPAFHSLTGQDLAAYVAMAERQECVAGPTITSSATAANVELDDIDECIRCTREFCSE